MSGAESVPHVALAAPLRHAPWRAGAVLALWLAAGPGRAQQAPAPEVTCLARPVTLTGGTTWDLPAVPILADREHVYGLSYEVRGSDGLVFQPAAYRTLRADDSPRQDVDVDNRWAAFRVEVSGEWQTGRLEVFTKTGAARLEATFALLGTGTAELRSVRLVEGGFPRTPPVPGAPYPAWIESLRPDRAAAGARPFLHVAPDGVPPWTPGSPRIRVGDAEAAALRAEVAPFLGVAPRRLLELVPKRRPFGYDGGATPDADTPLRWDPRDPTALRRPDGTVFDPAALFAVTGEEEVQTPTGAVVRYAYHDPAPPAAAAPDASPPERVYLDRFLTSVQASRLSRAAYQLAVLYRLEGEADCARAAAAILAGLGTALPEWPVFGRESPDAPGGSLFWPPDTCEYESVFVIDGGRFSGLGTLEWPARAYDLVRDAPVWDEMDTWVGGDARGRIEAGLLHVARQALRADASRRTAPGVLTDGAVGTELRALVAIGRAVGCPELLHAAVLRANRLLRAGCLPDGVPPAGNGALQEMASGVAAVAAGLAGYVDPPGFTAIVDGRRWDGLDPRRELPLLARATAAAERLRFPDGALVAVHDTWSDTSRPERTGERSPVTSYLLPEFGHAVLGRGRLPQGLEAHLHYSGFGEHGHADTLNLALWAYGDELVADLGMAHTNRYPASSLAHNLVVVDGQGQRTEGVERADLVAWHPAEDAAQVVQAAADGSAYTAARLYRRTLISVPLGTGRDAVVDIFEVAGGSRHEWLANGAADYEQVAHTNLAARGTLASLGAAGAELGAAGPWAPRDEPGQPSPFYGAFRSASVYTNALPWEVTLSPGAAVSPGTAGAGARAVAEGAKPGLRLHWLSPLDGQVFLCDAPRQRYRGEERRTEEAQAAWSQRHLTKVIVRREGTDLASTFVCAWEPFLGAPGLAQVARLEGVPDEHGVGVTLQSAACRAVVLYRRPGVQQALSAAGLTAAGAFAVARQAGAETAVDLFDGDRVEAGPLIASLSTLPPLPVTGFGIEKGEVVIRVEADLSAYPLDPQRQPHAGQVVRFEQDGQPSRWVPVARIDRATEYTWRLVLAREPGFSFDAARSRLREQAYPYRTLGGQARVVLPARLNLIHVPLAGGGHDLLVRATGDVRLLVKAGTPPTVAKVRATGETVMRDLPLATEDGTVRLTLSPRDLGSGWWHIALGQPAVARQETALAAVADWQKARRLPNAGFEDSLAAPVGWSMSYAGTMAVASKPDVDPHGGVACLRVDPGPTNTPGLSRLIATNAHLVQATDGEAVCLSVWARGPATSTLSLAIGKFDAAGRSLGNEWFLERQPLSGTWTEYTATRPLRSGGRAAGVRVMLDVAGKGTVLLDDAKIEFGARE